ncbi:hypothetical protein IE81DRAFT_330878 [Ceraceosorus guamensis]|uniref:Uncharacterized protein n=1 Tax=Ceraceosorus guamensis TaxID=1522189 RepID=A0A316VYL0_9BASI|nr:hypothetical protein IE81DRAFT_330878 [Ceraceosorus guamensis]PWN41483.1 hypothetical protein IE81DRAFT_330878 [Ceraceosorus guamensis]
MTKETTPKGENVERGAKLKLALAAIDQLIAAQPAAEELATNWPAFQPLARALDSGKLCPLHPRGIPLATAVRSLKAKWHGDGSWPLLGSDEVWAPTQTAVGISGVAVSAGIAMPPRSVHPCRLLLRPVGVFSFQPPQQQEAQPHHELVNHQLCKQDPDSEEVARLYRLRGVHVAEADIPPDADD